MVSIMFRGSAATFVELDEAMLYAPSDERDEHHRPAKIEIVPSVRGADPRHIASGHGGVPKRPQGGQQDTPP
jgi:hypothetical protein